MPKFRGCAIFRTRVIRQKVSLKIYNAGVYWRRRRSRKRPYDLVKIENRSRKRSHKLHGNQNVSISSDSVYDSVAYDPVKTRLLESEAEAEEPRNRTLSLVYSSVFASDSVGLIFTRSYRSTLLIRTPTTTPWLVKTSL